MDNKQSLHLIEGTFLPSEAVDILLNLYNQKIKFHELKNFSTQECTGDQDLYSVKRIPELEADIETIKKFMAKATISNKKVQIYSTLSIQVV
ncbi:hypothetical protein FFWV33_13695 [Flavobacterium faecale]|uniref:Uncharacterized protein n=1 Tax=Flavobacterium faecale TaxID=1355330 RepID=A0A2S1LFH5_9FLAO|nr:hypothetical protein [Flavobacterium faecale]AWG22503.1 hypothetical protein FFWV33_13695 [Flavobacterium faecale]